MRMKNRSEQSYLFKWDIFLVFPTFFKAIKIKKRRYFEVMLAIYLKTLCAKLFAVKAVGNVRYIEDNGPFRGL